MENMPAQSPLPHILQDDPLGQRVFLGLRQFNVTPPIQHELSPDAQERLDRAQAWLSSRLTPEEIDVIIPD